MEFKDTFKLIESNLNNSEASILFKYDKPYKGKVMFGIYEQGTGRQGEMYYIEVEDDYGYVKDLVSGIQNELLKDEDCFLWTSQSYASEYDLNFGIERNSFPHVIQIESDDYDYFNEVCEEYNNRRKETEGTRKGK